MSTSATQEPRRVPPRPPRPPEGPLLIHTPAGLPRDSAQTGPAWLKAPPPTYHLAKAAQLAEALVVEAPPPTIEAAPPALSAVRCPKCREKFAWTTERPTTVKCPHCGTAGVLKASVPRP